MSTDWHDSDFIRISVRLTVQCGSSWKCPLFLISRCTEDTVSNGGILPDVDLRAECLAYILISLFCMKTLKESARDALLYTSLLQLGAWNSWSRMLCTEELRGWINLFSHDVCRLYPHCYSSFHSSIVSIYIPIHIGTHTYTYIKMYVISSAFSRNTRFEWQK